MKSGTCPESSVALSVPSLSLCSTEVLQNLRDAQDVAWRQAYGDVVIIVSVLQDQQRYASFISLQATQGPLDRCPHAVRLLLSQQRRFRYVIPFLPKSSVYVYSDLTWDSFVQCCYEALRNPREAARECWRGGAVEFALGATLLLFSAYWLFRGLWLLAEKLLSCRLKRWNVVVCK